MSQPETNGWRIAGRTLAVVAFFLVTYAQQDAVSGITAGLMWWGIFEFIGWQVDQNRARSAAPVRRLSNRSDDTEKAGKSDEPETVFTRAQDRIVYEEYREAKEAQAEADAEARRVREREHAARLERENAEYQARLKEEQRQKSLELERQVTQLQRKRAEAWSEAWRKAWPTVCASLLLLALAFGGGIAFYKVRAKHIADAADRAAMQRKTAEDRLAARKADEQSEASKLEKARLAAEREQKELERARSETSRLEAEKEREEARIAYVETHGRRVKLEKELIASLRGSPLIEYQRIDADVHRFARERVNSNPKLVAERRQLRASLLERAQAEYLERADRVRQSEEPDDVKRTKLVKLASLYANAKRHIESASLASLRKLKE